MHIHFTRPHLGLSAKVIFIVTLVSLVGVLTSSFFLTRWHNTQLIDSAELSLNQLGAPIKVSLQHAMLTHDQAMLNQVVYAIAQEPGLQRIRVLDNSGQIRSSSYLAEVGESIAPTQAECQACHVNANSQPASSKTSALIDTPLSQYLVNVSPIENGPLCRDCHSPEVKTLGLLMIEAPVKDLNTQIRESSQQILWAALLTFGLLVGLMVPILRRYIAKPVAELSKGVAEISSSNLDYRIHVSSHDEIGDLASGLETMRQQLKTSRAQMELRNRELAVLYEVALVTGQLLDIETILASVLDIVIEKKSLATGLIYLWDRETNRFERRVSRGNSEEKLRQIELKRREPGGDLTQIVANSGEALFVPDRSVDPYFRKFWATPTVSSYVNIPLKSKGRVIGTMELTSLPGQFLTQRQVEILKAVGHQIGIAIDNNSMLNETRRNAHESSTLYELGARISASLDMGQVLQAVTAGARQALVADIALVGLMDDEQHELSVRAADGTFSPDWDGVRLPLEIGHAKPGIAFNRVLNLENIPDDFPALAGFTASERVHALLAVPLWRGERLLGIVAVATRQPRHFIKEEVRLLTRLGQQVIIAVENARLYQQVRYLAVLEERDRLAREMHDNLAQELGYLDLKTTITRDLLARGDVAEAEASLLELKQVTREAYTDTREAIFSLRTVASLGNDFAGTLREYLAEYRAHYGLDARVVIQDEALTQFRSEAGVQVHRIIQEALTNVRKHARSTQAHVRFEREGDWVRITVEDNGRGFDPAELNEGDGRQCYGIQIMRERAEGIGGTLEFISRPNEGTRVVLRVPTAVMQ